MNTEKQDKGNNGRGWSRWLRVGLLTFSMAGPVINTLLNQMRNRSQMLREQAEELPDAARAIQATSVQRLDELGLSSRKRVVEQTQQLRKQARQLQMQAQQLQKALREEAKQRQKLKQLQKQLRKSRLSLSKDLLKRGEGLTGDLIEQGGKLSHELLERGGKVSQDLLKRSGKVSQDLLERGGEVTQGLVQRGSRLSQNVAGRSGQLLEPARKRDSRFWTILGFTTGLFAAGVVTYVLVRRRVASVNSDSEMDEQIELPSNAHWNSASFTHPSGEIHHVDSKGASVATITGTKVENTPQEATTEKMQAAQTAPEEQVAQPPADAAFVGVVSTKRYYPANVAPEAKDVIYFATEDEAKADGFTSAPIE